MGPGKGEGRGVEKRVPVAVVVSLTVDARSVRRGDEVMVGGVPWRVRDIVGAPAGCKWLEFESGERMLMRPYTAFYASRRRCPR